MNLRVAAALVFSALVSTMAADDMAVKNQEKKVFKGRSEKSLELQYLLFLPQTYKEDQAKKWPLMLFLHGAGERGSDIAKVTVHGPPKLVKERSDFPFLLVSPQCPAGQTWSDEALLGLLDEVIQEYRVDKSRVYLTGLSMGGYGTWSLGLRNPDRFAAIAPICGGGDFLPILLPPPGKESFLKRLPVWVFHGGKDDVVPLTESERMVTALKKIGNETVKLTVYPEAGHDSWTETYNNQELYDWFLQHKISAKPSARKGRKSSSRTG
jgi:predicted peptidase